MSLMENPYAKKSSRSAQSCDPKEAPASAAMSPNQMQNHVKPEAVEKQPQSATEAATESASALVIAAADKAGMDGIDRARIDAIILRESGNSLYMQKQRQRDQQVNQKIEQLRAKLLEEEGKNANWKSNLEHVIDQEIPEILSKRSNRSTCVVIDFDMFFIACELLTRPDLVHKPTCVGGSMISTSNYVARKYGVRSAMAGWVGDKLVEELSGGKEKLIHLPSNFQLYKEKSSIAKNVLQEYDPNLRAYSLDEAFMDLAPYLAIKLTKNWTHTQIRDELLKRQQKSSEPSHESSGNQSPAQPEDEEHHWSQALMYLASFPAALCMRQASSIIAEMRERVCKATGGLTCSAGLAPCFLLAKIASDRNKPNGQCLVESDHDSIVQFLHPLPTRKVSGIGRVTEKTLQAFGIKTVADLYRERALVRFLFKPTTASSLLRASLGCSSSDDKALDDEDASSPGQKGISRERTFRSGQSWSEINTRLEDIGRLLASDMDQKNIWARTITLKVKLNTFDVYSRARSMSRGVYLHDAKDIVGHASEILREIRNEQKGSPFNVRLLGIRCSNFRGEEDSGQSSMEQFLDSGKNREVGATSVAPQATRSPFQKRTITQEKIAIQNASTTGSSVTTKTVSCPVCQRPFPEHQNFELNQHIDACLSGPVVRNAIREQEQSLNDEKSNPKSVGTGRKRRITDFW